MKTRTLHINSEITQPASLWCEVMDYGIPSQPNRRENQLAKEGFGGAPIREGYGG